MAHHGSKDLVSNINGRSLPIPSCLNHVTTASFPFTPLNNSVHGSNIVWSKELVFLFYFPLLFSIFD